MNFDAVRECLIAEANRAGLKEYEVYFAESSDLSTETLKDEISSFSSGTRGGICFRCIMDGHMGSASTELLTAEEMGELVARAMTNAKCVESEDKAILYRGSEKYAEVALPDIIAPDAATAKKMALQIQKNTYEKSEYVTDGTQSAVFTNEFHMELMNSHGLRLSGGGSLSGAYVQAVIQKGGEAQDAFDFTLELTDTALADVSQRALEEAISKAGATEIPSGKYDVIISAKEMRALLSAHASVFSAKSAQLGMSLLKGKEGQTVASEIITLVDDPMREGCPMQTCFDGEGVATYRKNVIEKGVLKTLLYDLSTADRAGVETTGNGQRVGYSEPVSIRPYSFYIDGGTCSPDELKGQLRDGLYITEFKGMHAGCNAVTGDFSIESAGYLVKDGKLREAVKSFTVAGNFFELLKNVEAIADRVEFGIPSGFTVFGAPDTLVRNMSVAGT